MKHARLALAIACCVSLPPSALAEPFDGSAVAEEVCKDGKFVGNVAVGDLNADGRRDVALFVSCDPAAETLQLVVLLGHPNGTYRPLAKTLVESHIRRWDSVKIARGVLVVEQGCAAACNSNWNRSFKFRLDSAVLRLIGEDHSNYEEPAEDGPKGLIDYDTHYGSSINYVTGIAVHWRKSKSAAKQVRRTVRFPAGLNASFQDFDFDRLVPGVHGYINDKFELSVWGKE